MRLLLADVDPASILCLTFTKAGAAEMADRIHARLAYWVRLKDADLAAELRALGEDFAPENVEEARKLFAKVLDATGGGLRIQTIHAFAQSLLAAFPAEAGIVPGFRPLEGREEALLARETLADMLVAAEERNDAALIEDVQSLSRRLGEAGAEAFLLRSARAPEAMEALGTPELIEDRLRRGLSVPLGDIKEKIVEWCSNDVFDCEALAADRCSQPGMGNGEDRHSQRRNCRKLAGIRTRRACRTTCVAAGGLGNETGRFTQIQPETDRCRTAICRIGAMVG